MKKEFYKSLFVILLLLNLFGCSNNPDSTYTRLNNAYNQKNNTENRSVVLDTIIATTLYNYPELVPVISKNKTHSKTSTKVDASSNSISNTHINDFGNSITTETHTNTRIKSKTKTKSVTTGIGISPNLDFYLK